MLLLVFGLAVVWQFGGGGPGAGLEGAWVGKAKATTSRFPQRVRLPASRGTEPAWGLVALGRWGYPPKSGQTHQAWCKALFRSIVFERPFGQNRHFNAGSYFRTFDAT